MKKLGLVATIMLAVIAALIVPILPVRASPEASFSRSVTQGITMTDGVTVASEGPSAIIEVVPYPVVPSRHTAVITETLAVSEDIRVNFNMAAIGETLVVSENIKVDFTAGKASTSPWVYVVLPIFCALIVLLVVARRKIALWTRN